MNVRFQCPECECAAKVSWPVSSMWQCPVCDHRVPLAADGEYPVRSCVVCGAADLYKKKDFPHGLGMTILIVACLVSFVTYGWYEKWLTWAILIGTAIFDGVLFLLVGDVVVCHRCNAHYRSLPKGTDYPPFDLGVAERYRQERIRRRQLETDRRSSAEG